MTDIYNYRMKVAAKEAFAKLVLDDEELEKERQEDMAHRADQEDQNDGR